MVHTSRQRFFEGYKLELAKEFDVDGNGARWAPSESGPRFWGEEDGLIDFEDDHSLRTADNASSAMAVSSDGQIIAVATSANIRIYECHTRQLLSELKGHPHGIKKLVFAPTGPATESGSGRTNKYTLISAGSHGASKNKLIIPWQLDDNGREVNGAAFEPFKVDVLADNALATVSDSLQGRGITEEELSSVRSSLTKSLDAVEKQHRLQLLPSAQGSLPTRGADLFSIHGEKTRMLYVSKNEPTQRGTCMRPAADLPQVVIASIAPTDETGKPCLQTMHTLQGHTDMVSSVAFSPNGKLVASASWDQIYRIWSAETGECLHMIGPTGDQNTRVVFSPDSERVFLCGSYNKANPLFGLYSTSTGDKIGQLECPEEFYRRRDLALSPDGKFAAVSSGISVLLWDTTEGDVDNDDDKECEDKSGRRILKLAEPSGESSVNPRTFRIMASLQDIAWVDDGRKILVRGSDSTVFVWDPQRNVKWRFQRRVQHEGFVNFMPTFAYVQGGENGTLVSFDVDGKIRFWTL